MRMAEKPVESYQNLRRQEAADKLDPQTHDR
jgi:hypothetical protein